MALKPDYNPVQTDISYFATGVMEKGMFVCLSTIGSGAAQDQSQAVVHFSVAAGNGAAAGLVSGDANSLAPFGILMTDVVNKDLSQTHINQHKDEVQIGSKVWVLNQGWVVTNMLRHDCTPTVGQAALLAVSGRLTNGGILAISASGAIKVGRWLSTKDENGYAKVWIDP